jgi:predicted nucleic acid-binding protein
VIEILPVQLSPCDQALALEAARIKTDFSMSHADAFAVATARRENAAIVTGHSEFAKVEHLVHIDWL